jgi:MFS family permease
MFSVKRAKIMVWLSAGLFLAMIVINTLANLLPINGITTGAVSDSFPNLFAPIGLTFAIWGIIYLLAGAYQVIQMVHWKEISDDARFRLEYRINVAFSVSSLLNSIWIFFWHFRLIGLSMAVIFLMLISLSLISIWLKKQQTFPKLVFGVYFGWITMATIANVTAFLVSLGWPNTTVGATLQTMGVVLVASAIGALTTLIQKDIGFGMVILWALLGIYLKHINPLYFDRGYSAIYNSAIAGFVLVLTALAITSFNLLKKRKISI